MSHETLAARGSTKIPSISRGGTELSLVVHRHGAGVMVVTVAGKVDMVSAPHFEQCVGELLALSDSDVVLDLDQIRFFGSNGLATLVRLGELAESTHTVLHLVCLTNRHVARPLALTGLATMFNTYSSREQALTAVRHDKAVALMMPSSSGERRPTGTVICPS